MSTEVSLLLTVAMCVGAGAIRVFALSSPDGTQAVGVLRNTLVATIFGACIALLVSGLRIFMASPRARIH